jgi:hypothetical protein
MHPWHHLFKIFNKSFFPVSIVLLISHTYNAKVRLSIFVGLLLLQALVFSVITSCDKFEGDQTVPSYLAIDTIYLENNNLIEEGELTHNFTDVWIYVDDQLIGAFELPAIVPVLVNGNHKLALYAGIKLNAMSGTRVQYPFVRPKMFDQFNFTIDSVTNLNPGVTYYETAKFEWIEDFEDSPMSLIPTSNSDTSMTFFSYDTPVPFLGSRSGYGFVDNTSTVLEITTFNEDKPGFDLPDSGQPIFLEMEYKSNATLRVGVFIRDISIGITQHSVLMLVPSGDQWKKVYVNFTPVLNAYYYAEFYNVFFRVDKGSSPEAEYIMLDNLKLITRD